MIPVAQHGDGLVGAGAIEPDAEAVTIGFDVARIAPDGRLETVHGLLDRGPG